MKMAGQQQRGNKQGGENRGEQKGENKGRRNHFQNKNDKSAKTEQKKPVVVVENDSKGDEAAAAAAQKAKFTGRSRLFVGNLPNDTTENEFRKLFEPFGELSEVYVNTQRSFGFVRLDTRQNAENAKTALDGVQKKGRSLRVRFATHGAALRVKHLSPYVSNELLESAFTQFGSVERAVVIVDDRGKPTGEGIVEFARKPGAQQALNRINDGIFLLGANPRPIIVEPLEQKDEEDGLPEKFILKNQQYHKEHEQNARFASPQSFEFEFAQKWKDLYRMEGEQKRQLARQMEEAFQKLDMEMESAHIEHQAMLLRQDYLRKQEELKRMEEEMQQRLAMRRQEEDIRRQEDERHRQELMIRQQQEEELRRRQMERRQRPSEDMFNQQQKRAVDREMSRGDMPREMRVMHEEMRGQMRGEMRDMPMQRERNAPPMQPPPAPPAALGLDRQRQHEQQQQQGGLGGQGMNNPNMGGAAGQVAMRQSRFDQPPTNIGGGGGGGGMMERNQSMGNGMGGMGNHMGGGNMMGNDRQGNMGGRQMQQQQMQQQQMQGGQMQGGQMQGGERMMDRRRAAPGQRDPEFYEEKRPRRF